MLGAGQVGLAARQRRLVARDGGDILGDLRGQFAIIEREHQLALLDHLALGEMHRKQLALDARFHRHHRERLDIADGFQPDGKVATGGGHGHHRSRGALARATRGRGGGRLVGEDQGYMVRAPEPASAETTDGDRSNGHFFSHARLLVPAIRWVARQTARGPSRGARRPFKRMHPTLAAVMP